MILQDIRQRFIHQLSAIYDRGEAGAITNLVMDHFLGEGSHSIPGAAPVDDDLQSQLDEALERLLQHEPAQYVVGEAWFCGLRFSVNKHVLIPRPETEELVEWVVAGCRFPVDRLRILDVGTGSGCIAVTLKRRIRKAEVHAIDISEAALHVAGENADNLGADVHFHQMDFLAGEVPTGSFDLIISNPPYISRERAETLDRNVRDYEPGLALFVPGEKPFVFYHQLAASGDKSLSPGGRIYAEIHQGAENDIEKIFRNAEYEVRLNKDMQGSTRMIQAWKNL